MHHQTPRMLLITVSLALVLAACGGGGTGGGGGGGGGGTGPIDPPGPTITSEVTNDDGEATLLVGGTSLTLTFVDDVTDEPLPGLDVDIVENDVDSILVVTDSFGEYATYSGFVDPADFLKTGPSTRIRMGAPGGPSEVSDGVWGVPYIEDVMTGTPGYLTYVNPDLWFAWLENFGDYDGSPGINQLEAWLDDLVEAETTANDINILAAKPLSTPGFDDTFALLSGAATYDELKATGWLALWVDWYRQTCYADDAPIAVYVMLYEGLLTIFLWPDEDPPASLPTTFAALQGTVYDAETRLPVQDAFVVPTHLWTDSLTGLNGAYSLPDINISCSRYDETIFVVEKFGYLPYGFTGFDAGLNGAVTANFDAWLEPAIPWSFYGPEQFRPGGTWVTSADIGWVGANLNWSTPPTLTAAYDVLEAPLDVQVGDRIEYTYRYLGHVDPNARQKLNLGFTNARDTSGGWPTDFIGLSTSTGGGDAFTDVVLSKSGAADLPYGFTHAQDVGLTIRVLVIVDSAAEYRLVVDLGGVETHNALHAGNLAGTTLNQCAVWNGPTGGLPLQGSYQGRLSIVLWRGMVN